MDFQAKFGRTIDVALKFKARMLALGKVEARAKCPICPGMLRGQIVGRRQHFRMRCDGPCKMAMME